MTCLTAFEYKMKLLSFSGTSSSYRPGYGSEDEQTQQQQGEHAERSPANESTLPSKHTQVCDQQTN